MTHINKDYEMTHYTLSELMERALNPPTDAAEAKHSRRLVDRLNFCLQVLDSIKAGSMRQSDDAEPGVAMAGSAFGKMEIKS